MAHHNRRKNALCVEQAVPTPQSAPLLLTEDPSDSRSLALDSVQERWIRLETILIMTYFASLLFSGNILSCTNSDLI